MNNKERKKKEKYLQQIQQVQTSHDEEEYKSISSKAAIIEKGEIFTSISK